MPLFVDRRSQQMELTAFPEKPRGDVKIYGLRGVAARRRSSTGPDNSGGSKSAKARSDEAIGKPHSGQRPLGASPRRLYWQRVHDTSRFTSLGAGGMLSTELSS